MIISRLEIFNFKWFAEKNVLAFDEKKSISYTEHMELENLR